ncbi:MAG: adenylate/guanylate cyclase domain-containing protein [Actinomycetota bacterium]
MAEGRTKDLGKPDERIEFPGITEDIVDIGATSVGRVVAEPGWSWSTHVRPHVGGESCRARHVGVMLSGRLGVTIEDGTAFELKPGHVYDIPPGHDGYTVGDEPAVSIEWSGLRAFAGPRTEFRGRVLATLLFTDLVDSTGHAVRLGDTAWHDALTRHYEAARAQLERFGGREVKTTGDGLLAVFEGPAAALRGAAAIRAAAGHDDLHVRGGVHVGEVQLAGTDVRGVSVHEAARIMAAAAPNEILVSEITRNLAEPAGLAFQDPRDPRAQGDPGPPAPVRLCRRGGRSRRLSSGAQHAEELGEAAGRPSRVDHRVEMFGPEHPDRPPSAAGHGGLRKVERRELEVATGRVRPFPGDRHGLLEERPAAGTHLRKDPAANGDVGDGRRQLVLRPRGGPAAGAEVDAKLVGGLRRHP